MDNIIYFANFEEYRKFFKSHKDKIEKTKKSPFLHVILKNGITNIEGYKIIEEEE